MGPGMAVQRAGQAPARSTSPHAAAAAAPLYSAWCFTNRQPAFDSQKANQKFHHAAAGVHASSSCRPSVLLLPLIYRRDWRNGRAHRHSGHTGRRLHAIYLAHRLFRLDITLRLARRQQDADCDDGQDGEVSTVVDGAPDGQAVGQPQHLGTGRGKGRGNSMLTCGTRRTVRWCTFATTMPRAQAVMQPHQTNRCKPGRGSRWTCGSRLGMQEGGAAGGTHNESGGGIVEDEGVEDDLGQHVGRKAAHPRRPALLIPAGAREPGNWTPAGCS